MPAGPTRETFEIGRSVEGRPIVAEVHGGHEAKTRVVVLAGQHGDEPGAREAARRLSADPPGAAGAALTDGRLALAVIPEANPDGAARSSRTNAHGVDLNRDHRELSAPETRAVHRFLSSFAPHLLLDVHNFPARRSHLLPRWGEIGYDVLLGRPTNPAIELGPRDRSLARLERSIGGHLERQGYSWHRYVIFQRSGRVRPSTLTTRDARNGVALRFEIPTLLVEGRAGRASMPPETARRLAAALEEAVRAAIEATAEHPLDPPDPRGAAARPGSSVPVRSRWGSPRPGGPFLFLDPATGERRDRIQLPCVPGPVPAGPTLVPEAYAVPLRLRPVLGVLERHAFVSEDGAARSSRLVESYRRVGERSAPGADGGGSVSAGWVASLDRRSLGAYRLFPTAQLGGVALCLWLEPRSRFRLNGPETGPLDEEPEYPILRVMASAAVPDGRRRPVPRASGHARAGGPSSRSVVGGRPRPGSSMPRFSCRSPRDAEGGLRLGREGAP